MESQDAPYIWPCIIVSNYNFGNRKFESLLYFSLPSLSLFFLMKQCFYEKIFSPQFYCPSSLCYAFINKILHLFSTYIYIIKYWTNMCISLFLFQDMHQLENVDNFSFQLLNVMLIICLSSLNWAFKHMTIFLNTTIFQQYTYKIIFLILYG